MAQRVSCCLWGLCISLKLMVASSTVELCCNFTPAEKSCQEIKSCFAIADKGVKLTNHSSMEPKQFGFQRIV